MFRRILSLLSALALLLLCASAALAAGDMQQGSMYVNIELLHNTIRDIQLTGDFLPLCQDARELLLDKLRGVGLDADALRNALQGCDVGQWIMNLTNEQFITLLTN